MATMGKEQRLNCRMDADVMGWMRRAAAKKRITVSALVRGLIMEKFNERHAK